MAARHLMQLTLLVTTLGTKEALDASSFLQLVTESGAALHASGAEEAAPIEDLAKAEIDLMKQRSQEETEVLKKMVERGEQETEVLKKIVEMKQGEAVEARGAAESRPPVVEHVARGRVLGDIDRSGPRAASGGMESTEWSITCGQTAGECQSSNAKWWIVRYAAFFSDANCTQRLPYDDPISSGGGGGCHTEECAMDPPYLMDQGVACRDNHECGWQNTNGNEEAWIGIRLVSSEVVRCVQYQNAWAWGYDTDDVYLQRKVNGEWVVVEKLTWHDITDCNTLATQEQRTKCNSFGGNLKLFQSTVATTASAGPPDQPTSVVGDPHVVNVARAKFEIRADGEHKLVQIPRFIHDNGRPDLRVDAKIEHLAGTDCGQSFMTSLTIFGRWTEEAYGLLRITQGSDAPNTTLLVNTQGPEEYFRRFPLPAVEAGHASVAFKLRDVSFHVGKHFEGRYGRQRAYLNVRIAGLKQYKDIGGLLGYDDHADAEKLVTNCTAAQPGAADQSSFIGTGRSVPSTDGGSRIEAE